MWVAKLQTKLLIIINCTAGEEYDSEEAKQKLKGLVEKCEKEDFDFDDLNIEDDLSSDEDDSWLLS